jgi:hypothetical protein
LLSVIYKEAQHAAILEPATRPLVRELQLSR